MRSMQAFFPEALSQQPKKVTDEVVLCEICTDALAYDGCALGEEGLLVGEEELDDGTVISSQKIVYQPLYQSTQAQYEIGQRYRERNPRHFI